MGRNTQRRRAVERTRRANPAGLALVATVARIPWKGDDAAAPTSSIRGARVLTLDHPRNHTAEYPGWDGPAA